MTKVFMAMPTYDGTANLLAARAFYATPTRSLPVFYVECARSLLANGFNLMWSHALALREDGFTHFAMLHSDVIPDDGWLDVLMGEMASHRADVVSTVLPIKDGRGLTSTAVAGKTDWEQERRLTLEEVHHLPETFSAEDCGYPGHALLVNTGCWLADITRPWCDHVAFEIKDRIVRTPDKLAVECIPEDWGFSLQLHRRGAKVLATRKVKAKHVGVHAFSNSHAWGMACEHNREPLPIFRDTQPPQPQLATKEA